VSAAAPQFAHVYRWDLDKTYLDTNFEKLSRLVRIAFESPDEKVNVPGSAALLRELSGPAGFAPARVCIVSGSPTQMRRTLEKKLLLDGIRWHEFHLKPQWENLKRGRFRALRDQIGYKLPLLLRSRTDLDPAVAETLFGDDAEADAFIYSLYADIVAGRVDDKAMVKVLKAAGAYSDAVDRCLRSLRKLEFQRAEAVQRIFIHLDKRTPPSFFTPFGSRVVPVFNYFQAALVLFASGHLDAHGVIEVTRAFIEADKHSPEELANLFQDVVRRGHLPAGAMQDLGMAVQEEPETPIEARSLVWSCVERFEDLAEHRKYDPPAPPPTVDYLQLLEHLKRR
jgi:hypothetical protein